MPLANWRSHSQIYNKNGSKSKLIKRPHHSLTGAGVISARKILFGLFEVVLFELADTIFAVEFTCTALARKLNNEIAKWVELFTIAYTAHNAGPDYPPVALFQVSSSACRLCWDSCNRSPRTAFLYNRSSIPSLKWWVDCIVAVDNARRTTTPKSSNFSWFFGWLWKCERLCTRRWRFYMFE